MLSHSLFVPWVIDSPNSCPYALSFTIRHNQKSQGVRSGSMESISKVHILLSIFVEMCGLGNDKHYGQNEQVHHPVENTPRCILSMEVHRWRMTATYVCSSWNSLLGCQKNKVQLHQQRWWHTRNLPLGRHVPTHELLLDFRYPKKIVLCRFTSVKSGFIVERNQIHNASLDVVDFPGLLRTDCWTTPMFISLSWGVQYYLCSCPQPSQSKRTFWKHDKSWSDLVIFV